MLEILGYLEGLRSIVGFRVQGCRIRVVSRLLGFRALGFNYGLEI